MINFRYHLVSLTAVFLALTVGLILGTAALNGPAMEVMQSNIQSLRDSNDQYRAELSQLEADLNDDQAFAAEIAPSYLAGKLADKNILVVALPGADTQVVDGAVEMLGYAGATVSGRISILDDFFDPNRGDELGDLTETVTPETVQLPVTYDDIESMSYVLAAVTTGKAGGVPVEIPAGDITVVTSGLNAASLLTVETEPTGVADGVLILAGPGSTDSDAESRNEGMVTVANVFAVDAPTVYAATTSTGDGNPINELRSEDNNTVSTVDNVSSPQGQIAAVVSLADFMTTGKVDHLGTGEGVSGLLPAPA